MIDITKDEFWDNRYEEVSKKEKEKRKSKLKGLISRNKALTMLIILFSLLSISNILLIYNFFRVLDTL